MSQVLSTFILIEFQSFSVLFESVNWSTMPDIKITPLGAGQDVGRSCLLLTMGGKNIMLDCGMHMGFVEILLPLRFIRF